MASAKMRERQDRVVMDEREPAEDGDVFGHAEADIRKWFRRTVRHQARRRLGGVGDEAGAARQQNEEHVESREWNGRAPESRASAPPIGRMMV